MRKLMLSIQDLAVESFPVEPAAHRRMGTVHGRLDDAGAAPPPNTWQGEETCLVGVCTCWATCESCPELSCPTNCITACPVNCPAQQPTVVREPV